MKFCAPFVFLRSWALVVLYSCSRFYIFYWHVLEEYIFQVQRSPHLFQSCFHVVWDSCPPITRKMHSYFENLIVTNTLNQQVSLMDTHHDTSFRSILEDDSISLASKACICSCLGKGARLWLIIRPFICSFHITHFIFTSTCIFISVLFNLRHLVFSHVSVDKG